MKTTAGSPLPRRDLPNGNVDGEDAADKTSKLRAAASVRSSPLREREARPRLMFPLLPLSLLLLLLQLATPSRGQTFPSKAT